MDEAESRRSPSGAIVYGAIFKEGEDELKRSSSALAFSGFAAGLSMGFSLVTEGLLRAHLPDTAWRTLIAKLGYSMGFLIVVLGRQQLFTENTLTVILPLLRRWNLETLRNVARLWGVVLLANLLGAFLFAWVVGNTNVFAAPVRQAFAELGHDAMRNPFGTILIRGVFAGWLIALMVWLLPFAEVARVWVIIFITYVVGLGALSHVIAGSVETAYLVGIGEISLLHFLGAYFVPTLIGNIFGGVSLVAALNHAQVTAGGQGIDI